MKRFKVLIRSVLGDDRLCVLDHSRKYISKVLEIDIENIKVVGARTGSLKKKGTNIKLFFFCYKKI